jgi:hypothetical protein
MREQLWHVASSSTRVRDHGDGRRLRVGVGLGGDRRVANRYHEPPSPSKPRQQPNYLMRRTYEEGSVLGH